VDIQPIGTKHAAIIATTTSMELMALPRRCHFMVHLLVQALHPPDGRILCAGDHGILSEGYKMVTKSLSQERLLNLTIAGPSSGKLF
jgi:hypothetical protein